MKIPIVNIEVWNKKWPQKKKGFAIGTVVGFIAWALSVDFLIAISMIPVVAVLGLVFLPLIVGMILTTLTFGGIGYGTGMLTERLGAKQGYFTAVASLILIVGLFLSVYIPSSGLLNDLAPQQASAMQSQYAMKPYATLASVSGRGADEPGNIYIGYTSQGAVNGGLPVTCPSDCSWGCFPNTAECKSLEAAKGIDTLNYDL